VLDLIHGSTALCARFEGERGLIAIASIFITLLD
jgi:hypothetical protein